MSNGAYNPTFEQERLINHQNSAFVMACPGAGKTRTMVERFRKLVQDKSDLRGVAILSFTNAAIQELQSRLNVYGALPTPLFPNIIETFDAFLWHFFISPFGNPSSTKPPKLIVDKGEWLVRPYANARPLALKLFDRETGKSIENKLKESGFSGTITPYETAAKTMFAKSEENGYMDFEDVRKLVEQRIRDDVFSSKLGKALSNRFKEIIVDEAQDCNPSDLEIVDWFLKNGVICKLICDPNQSIYAFRGGVTDELKAFSKTFDDTNQLIMSGNFRSNPSICAAIVALRPAADRTQRDTSVGRYSSDSSKVQVIAYANGVTETIGKKHKELLEQAGLSLKDGPIVASTIDSACKAAGRTIPETQGKSCILLAEAIRRYQEAFASGNPAYELKTIHKLVLKIRGVISDLDQYHRYLVEKEIEDWEWRAEIAEIAHKLQIREEEEEEDASEKWLKRARNLLNKDLIGESSINVRLQKDSLLDAILKTSNDNLPLAQTIHSVKGLEYPSICVILTTKTKSILELLIDDLKNGAEEQARKLYVGASRAQRLLVLAVPKNHATRLIQHLNAHGCPVTKHDV